MTAGVYAIRNVVNGRRYVGQSENIERRITQHTHDLDGVAYFHLVTGPYLVREHGVTLEAGMDHFSLFQRDWISYGRSAFAVNVLEVAEDKTARRRREAWYILHTPSEYNTQRKDFKFMTDEEAAS